MSFDDPISLQAIVDGQANNRNQYKIYKMKNSGDHGLGVDQEEGPAIYLQVVSQDLQVLGEQLTAINFKDMSEYIKSF